MSFNVDTKYMERCLDLAMRGAGQVAPNPMVGAVLVYESRIIGEGYHQEFGGPHAEVNCLHSVSEADRALVSQSTLYVSLEPCAHFGKTPPCSDLIIQNRVPRVVVACSDPFPEVNGKGIGKLRGAGIEVVLGIAEEKARKLNKRFFLFHEHKRPFVILKWAQTGNGFIGHTDRSRLKISNELSNRLVHKWRSEEASIMVGTNTALFDDPFLSNRLWLGPSPVRVVLDRELRLPGNLNIFNGDSKTIIINHKKEANEGNLLFRKISRNDDIPGQVLEKLYNMELQSLIVEGGARLIQSFIDAKLWDEARIISNPFLQVPAGVPAPRLFESKHLLSEELDNDRIDYYQFSA